MPNAANEVLTLTDVECWVTEMTETLTDWTVTFERTEWCLVRGEGDDMEFDPAEAGSPGAKWTANGESFTLRLPEADGLAVGGHYELRFYEVPNITPDDEL